MDLADKHAIVTGGASGIGAATAREFARLGARVVVADVNGDGAIAVAGEIDGLAVACDVGDEADVDALVAEAERANGPVDVFFSNAGIATGGSPLDTSIDTWNAQWQVNVMAHVFAIRAVLPSMLERESGYLLHTASIAGILTSHGNLTYAVTKHAVVGLAEWLSITYHNKGIRVSLLAPLGVRTPMLGSSSSAFVNNAAGPIKEPDEVARMVSDAVYEERFLILTDPIAETWMARKTNDLERWLNGMRRMQAKIEGVPSRACRRGDPNAPVGRAVAHPIRDAIAPEAQPGAARSAIPGDRWIWTPTRRFHRIRSVHRGLKTTGHPLNPSLPGDPNDHRREPASAGYFRRAGANVLPCNSKCRETACCPVAPAAMYRLR